MRRQAGTARIYILASRWPQLQHKTRDWTFCGRFRSGSINLSSECIPRCVHQGSVEFLEFVRSIIPWCHWCGSDHGCLSHIDDFVENILYASWWIELRYINLSIALPFCCFCVAPCADLGHLMRLLPSYVDILPCSRPIRLHSQFQADSKLLAAFPMTTARPTALRPRLGKWAD